jgi:hypothetical protein
LFVLRPSAPGVREPTRYMEIPGLFKDGKMLADGEWVEPNPMQVGPWVFGPEQVEEWRAQRRREPSADP